MTIMTDPPNSGFRLSQLFSDTRYRSMTFQVIAFIALLLMFAYLGNNLINNLRAAGLNISYSFLGERAGYDLNQSLVPYDSESTHARAAIAGLLNTLLVAILSCVSATILGVTAGVLRLSNNWLVSKLMAVYVEIFRNIPVLIWLIIISTIVASSMPLPRAFRGEDATASMIFDAVAFTNRGVYIPKPLLEHGIFASASANWLLVLVVLGVSLFASTRVGRWANAQQEATGDRPQTLWINLGIFVVPFAVLMLIMGLTWDYPYLKGFNFTGGTQIGRPLIALWFALSIYTGAFIAENVRAGIQAVSKGQSEAAAALGLRQGRVMKLVILPQALRIIVPPLISQFLNITKNSSLAIAVGYADITATLGGITLNQTGRAIECVLLLMLFYLTASLMISGAMNLYNASIKLKER